MSKRAGTMSRRHKKALRLALPYEGGGRHENKIEPPHLSLQVALLALADVGWPVMAITGVWGWALR